METQNRSSAILAKEKQLNDEIAGLNKQLEAAETEK